MQSAWRLSGVEGQPPEILSVFLKISPTRTVAELSRKVGEQSRTSPASMYRKDNQPLEFQKALPLRTVAELSRKVGEQSRTMVGEQSRTSTAPIGRSNFQSAENLKLKT